MRAPGHRWTAQALPAGRWRCGRTPTRCPFCPISAAKLQIRLNGCSLSSTVGFLREVAVAIDLPLSFRQPGESRGV